MHRRLYFVLTGIDPRNLINSCGLREHRLGYTEDTWAEIFMPQGGTYRPPKLLLCADEVDTACGFGQGGDGAVLLCARHEVYLDTSFFEPQRLRKPILVVG